MGGDFSRRSLVHSKNYDGVAMQQGRVQVDADWNEELALRLHRVETETIDVIGDSGTAKGSDGFEISPTPDGLDLFIHPGRYYVDGILCEIVLEQVPVIIQPSAGAPTLQALCLAQLASSWLDGRPFAVGDWVQINSASSNAQGFARITAVADPGVALSLDADISAADVDQLVKATDVTLRRAPTYLAQPFYPSPVRVFGSPPTPSGSPPASGLELGDGTYVVYLALRRREVNALEDPHIREVALGGPDTAIRLQTAWQVRLLKVDAAAKDDLCTSDFKEWDQLVASGVSTGTMNARSVPQQPQDNPCMLPPGSGFQGLQNQLYRIEILTPGDQNAVSIIWSRDNAMVETAVTGVDPAHPNVVKVADLGKDDLHRFAINDRVELVDRDDELAGSPRFLAQIVAPAPDPTLKAITLSAAVPNPGQINNPGTNNFRLRRWDMSGATVSATGIPVQSGWMDIEAGIQVEFSNGYYAPGAHWLIPARVATADIEWPPFQVPNSEPIPQPPLDPRLHLCRIASIVAANGKWTLGDCRRQFPPLTHICADDVCYEAQCDALANEKTVQAALDELCELSRLRFHKKMLHGWGIVCGLQARCAGNGHDVSVLGGYAIDCEGNDIQLKQTSFDVIKAITTPSGIVDGEYVLILDAKAPGKLRIAPYAAPPETLQQALAGTFWPRYYDTYLKPLLNYLDSLSGTPPPVSKYDELISSLTNLLAQYNDATNGAKVYISAQEHEVLADFYRNIAKLLYDLTFCGFKAGMRPMPDYPKTIGGMSSIFAIGNKTRIRIDAKETAACAVGGDNTIPVYSLANGALMKILTLPAAGGAVPVVQDALFSQDGKSLVVIATLGSDSIVASVVLDSENWSTTTLSGVTLHSLANPKGGVYAVGIGKGLYLIAPPAANAAISATPVTGAQFVAVGHLVMGGTEDAVFATANSATDSTKFDRIIQITPSGTKATISTFVMPEKASGTLQDDIAVSSVNGFHIYVTCALAGVANKQLAAFFAPTQTNDGGKWQALALPENTPVRFAENRERQVMLMAYVSSNHIDAVPIVKSPDLKFGPNYCPAEFNPVATATGAAGKSIYILNGETNTMTRIPVGTAPWTEPLFAELLEYRNGMLAAYWDLFDAVLQYLKDGFCDLLLVECPTCNGDETLYVAGISVRDAKVYKICNFALRRYVHSFPTVEYWLSVVPVIPILGWFIRQLCCEIFTNTFANSEKFIGDAKDRSVGPSVNLSVRQAVTRVTDWRSMLISGFPVRRKAGQNFATDYLVNQFRPPEAAGIAVTSGQNAQALAQQLAAANVTVKTVRYDPTKLSLNITRSLLTPARIQPGSTAVLAVDAAGNVQYAFPASDQVQMMQTEVQAVQKEQAAVPAEAAASLHDQVTTLTTQLADLKQSQAAELAARDAKITELVNTTQAMQAQLQKLKRPTRSTPPKR